MPLLDDLSVDVIDHRWAVADPGPRSLRKWRRDPG